MTNSNSSESFSYKWLFRQNLMRMLYLYRFSLKERVINFQRTNFFDFNWPASYSFPTTVSLTRNQVRRGYLWPILKDLVAYFRIVTDTSGFFFALWVLLWFCSQTERLSFFHLKRTSKCRNTGCLDEAGRINRKEVSSWDEK